MQHSAFLVCICKLTRAWISCETSTKLLGMPTYSDRSSSLLWTLSHANSSLCCSVSTALSVVRRQLPSSRSFVQLPSRVPLPTSGHAEISSPKVFVRFRAKTDEGIVCLADHLRIVTPGIKPRSPGPLKFNTHPKIKKKEKISCVNLQMTGWNSRNYQGWKNSKIALTPRFYTYELM